MRAISTASLACAIACACASASLGCREPTKITVTLTTDVDCAKTRGATVTAGKLGEIETKAPSAKTSACEATRIGSVVVVPSGANDDEVAIKAVLGVGKSAADCTPPYGPGCVVARRALHYIPHTPLVVPIHLEAACEGVACDPSTTCVHGQCVSAQIPDSTLCESGNGCDEGVLFPDAGARDATTAIADGGDAGDADATIDATTDATIDGAVAACGDMGGLAAGAPWPMAGYCATRPGRSPFVGPQTPALKWAMGVREVYGLAVGADGTLYFVDGNQLTAVAADGGVMWRGAQAVTAQTPVLGSDGRIYAGGAFDPNLYAFAPDGAVADTLPLGLDAGSAAVDFRASGGTLYVRVWDVAGGLGNALVGTYDVVARRFVHATPVGDAGVQTLTIGTDGTLYAASYDSVVRAIAPSGVVAWTFDGKVASSAQVSQALVSGSRVVVATYNGVRAIEADGGAGWVAAVQSTGQAGLAAGADGTIYVGTSDGYLVAMRPADGRTLWQSVVSSTATPYVSSAPVVDGNGNVYTGTATSGVHALGPDGGARWSFDAGGIVIDSLAVGDGVLYFHTDFVDGGMTLYAVGP